MLFVLKRFTKSEVKLAKETIIFYTTLFSSIIMKDLAPHITRQRLLIEGFYKIEVDESVIKEYYKNITSALDLRTYAEPIIHSPSGVGKEINQGYDAFVPLIDRYVKPRPYGTRQGII